MVAEKRQSRTHGDHNMDWGQALAPLGRGCSSRYHTSNLATVHATVMHLTANRTLIFQHIVPGDARHQAHTQMLMLLS